MNYDNITCPYCFGQFSHKQVHFRMETVFDETELNDEGLTENELLKRPDTNETRRLIAQTRLRRLFLSKDDSQYLRFWRNFEGGTTEQTLGRDQKLRCRVHQLPILNPQLVEHRAGLKKQRNNSDNEEDYFIYDGDGMVAGVEDVFGFRTRRRVCPKCHNPLPMQYGKYDTKYIAIIGMTGAGKTIYISQLLKHMSKYLTYVDMATYFTSDHETDFINANAVHQGEPLPNSTGKGTFSQPMFYDFQTKRAGNIITNTVVIYDIAGEDCETIDDMAKYADYINHANGIILLIDPKQLQWVSDDGKKKVQPEAVLNTIHGAVTTLNTTRSGQFAIPIAVCVSKSDMFADLLENEDIRSDISPAQDKSGNEIPAFNAVAYNRLEKELREHLRTQPLHITLKASYACFNYFAFSAIGGPVESIGNDENGNSIYCPVNPPEPIRIAEPLLWLLYQFGYIGSNARIRLPERRQMPSAIEEPAQGFMARILGRTVSRELTEEEKETFWYEE